MTVDTGESSAVEISTEDILAEIKQDIQTRQLDGLDVAFEDIPNPGDRFWIAPVDVASSELLNGFVEAAQNLYLVSTRHYLDKSIKGIVKRVVRKFISFYTIPITSDQNAFNAAVVNSLNQLCALLSEQQALLEQQQRLIESLSAQLNKGACKDVSELRERSL
jgi:hypothetical protein